MKIMINKILLILLFIPAICFSQEKIDLLILNKQYDEALQQIEELLQKDPRANLFLEKGLIYN